MPDSILPATAIAEELDHAGYTAIGLDHFALPNDPLASAASTGKLRRNFQGYTDDTADALIAFGASAISEFPQGFAQAARDTLAWADAVAHNKPPISRGRHHGGRPGAGRDYRPCHVQLFCRFWTDCEAVRVRCRGAV